MSNVKIALRVRPLSEREKFEDNSSQPVVEVEDDKTVAITNLKVPASNAGDSRERVKHFCFDYCFDSMLATKENCADQTVIYEKLGDVILQSLARGQDACVLAYGQSSSGKTYTMQGTASEPGLAPRLCRALADSSKNQPFEATVSFFEIYNERVRDLLVGDEGSEPARNLRPRRDLRVREHPKKGPYVEELSGVTVKGGEELCEVWCSGARRRRTAPTATNLKSSRSHALLSVKRHFPEPQVTLTLLDLAGSERPSRANQSLPRQKEGANINKSLVALANVISALVTAGPKGGRYVPYRDSVLTWLLKDTLSGRATTVMIATVSPSASCYSETVNTMRWAARAARIPASNGRNSFAEPPHERAIRQLKAEITRLKALLAVAATSNEPQFRIGTQMEPASHVVTDVTENENKDSDKSEGSEATVKVENSAKSRVNEEVDSIDSLASSRISIASADTFSGNNSIPPSNSSSNRVEDAFFGPRLERAGSAHDVKPPIPLRNKKRQYSSHEALPTNKLNIKKSNLVPRPTKPRVKAPLAESKIKSNPPKVDVSESSVPEDENEAEEKKNDLAYQPFNKRADIVASVTDRLYSKLKKKEEGKIVKAVPKNDKKQPPLSELQLCNNARKKLLDMSHRALWTSRRFKIGVPVETQTDRISAIRVKNVSTDVPEDLEPFERMNSQCIKEFRNAAVLTEVRATLCKEASVGTPGSFRNEDKCIETDQMKESPALVIKRTCGNNTEDTKVFNAISTQTEENPQIKKRSSFTKYLKFSHEAKTHKNECDRSAPGIFNISISHDCSLDTETDGISDDSLEIDSKNSVACGSNKIIPPPDLLHNHNSNDVSENINIVLSSPIKKLTLSEPNILNSPNAQRKDGENTNKTPPIIKRRTLRQDGNVKFKIGSVTDNKVPTKNESKSVQVDSPNEAYNYLDFLDDLYVPLPRIFFNPENHSDRWPSMKHLIMGRNENMYPYNIKVSPRREKANRKRVSKTVSWKSEEQDYRPSCSSNGKSIMKKSFSMPVYTQMNESETLDSDDIISDALDDRISPPLEYFKGIYCWGDSSPMSPRRKKPQTSVKKPPKNQCVQYAEATCNFLNEATSLVSNLSKVSEKICDSTMIFNKSVNKKNSPNCNTSLHILDEKYKTKNYSSNCSHIINDSLMNYEEHMANMLKDQSNSRNNHELINYEDDLHDEDDEIEEKLLGSLHKLKSFADESSEYFSTVGDTYTEKFYRKLPSPKVIDSTERCSMHFHGRKSPRRYLQQLLEIRRELVDSTKRDEDISKQFHSSY